MLSPSRAFLMWCRRVEQSVVADALLWSSRQSLQWQRGQRHLWQRRPITACPSTQSSLGRSRRFDPHRCGRHCKGFTSCLTIFNMMRGSALLGRASDLHDSLCEMPPRALAGTCGVISHRGGGPTRRTGRLEKS
eukprot:UN1663